MRDSRRQAAVVATERKARGVVEIDERIGRRLRSRREQLGITKTSVAETLGITRAQLTKYENGINRVSPARLEKLSDLLDVGISWFFQLDNNPVSENDSNCRSVQRLVIAFRKISSQDDRTTIVELAERFALRSNER